MAGRGQEKGHLIPSSERASKKCQPRNEGLPSPVPFLFCGGVEEGPRRAAVVGGQLREGFDLLLTNIKRGSEIWEDGRGGRSGGKKRRPQFKRGTFIR